MKPYFVPSLFLFGTLVFGVLYLQEPPGARTSIIEGGPGTVPYNQLQQYRQETEVKRDIETQKAQMEKRLSGPSLESYGKTGRRLHKTEILRVSDPKAYDLADDVSHQPVGLDQRMDEFLAKKQRYEELEQTQKLAYVKEFISEARTMGFVVVVNDQMEIESVTKAD